MKRILILALLTLFSLQIPTFAEGEQGMNEYQKEAYSALFALGYLNETYTEEVLLEKDYILRAEFAELIYKAYSPEKARSDNLYFHDVPRLHYAAEPISVLVEKGIISVGADKMFYPERYITPIEAAKMVEYAIGCGPLCDTMGGYPKGVEQVAQDLDLFDGVKRSDKLTFLDALILIYNGLDVKMPEVTINGATINSGEETFLSKYSDIYSGEGILSAYSGASVYGDDVNEDEVIIGDMHFESSKTDVFDYLGKEVRFLYHDDDGVYTLLWVGETGKSEELSLNYIENAVSFDSEKYRFNYIEDGKEKHIDISKNPNVLYNGEYLSENIVKTLESEWHRIRFISSAGNDADAVIIEAYDNVVLNSVDKTNEILYVKSCDAKASSLSEKIELKKYKNVTVVLADKTIGAFSDIKKDSLLSIERAKDSIKIFVASQTAEGRVESITEENDYEIITIDGKSYTVYKKNLELEAVVGSKIMLMLDVFGYAADTKHSTGAVKYGYLMKAYYNDEAEKAGTFIKMYTSDDEIVTMPLSDTVRIDGKRQDSPETALGALAPAVQELIVYSENQAGEIVKIDTAELNGKVTEDNKLIKTQKFSSQLYSSFEKKIGPKIRVGASTLVVGVPADANDSSKWDRFTIGNGSNLSHDITYNVESYSYGERSEFADAVVLKNSSFGSDNFVSTRYLVEKVTKVWDEDEIVYKVSGYHGNDYKELVFSSELSNSSALDIKEGDLIHVGEYYDGKISQYTLDYRPGVTGDIIKRTYSLSGARLTTAYVHDVIGESIFCGFDNGETWEEIFAPTGVQVFVYDGTAKEKIIKGTTADIKSYLACGDDCSKVLVYLVNGQIRNFIVYQ